MQQHAVFPHQYQPDWQHHQQHAQTHHQYAQTQAAAAANAVAQQQQQHHYGRMTQNSGSTNGNSMAPGMSGVDGRDLEHGPGSMIPGGDAQISDENRKVLEWIAQVLNNQTREGALLELSKKREQVPELALILWHSFGEDHELLHMESVLTICRSHDLAAARDHLGLPSSQPVTAHGGG